MKNNKMCKLFSIQLLLVLGFLLVGPQAANSTVVVPTSYDMLNGEGGSWSYTDNIYNGSGNNTTWWAPLSGGTGRLTDGVIAYQSYTYYGWSGLPEPYVGWSQIDPTITFHFPTQITLSTVTLWVDYFSANGVMPPSSVQVTAGGTTKSYSVTPPSAVAPLGIVLSDVDLSGSSFDVQLFRDMNSSQWVLLSEVLFDATVVPEPSTLIIWSLLGGLGIAIGRRCRRKAA
jgi:hypothetical protein